MWKSTGLAAGFVLVMAGAAHAVSPSEVDDFQGGTVENWGAGQIIATNIANGGPTGLGDRYLQIESSNRLAVFNTVQWVGDFQSSGVLDIGVDFLNPSTNAQALDMRIVLFSPADTRFTSAVAHIVPADDAWHSYTFSLRQADLINVLDTGTTYANLMTNVSRMMFRYDDVGQAGGTPFVGKLGIDNVAAVVPEPAAAGLIALMLPLVRRRR
jgi:hypothetical protein